MYCICKSSYVAKNLLPLKNGNIHVLLTKATAIYFCVCVISTYLQLVLEVQVIYIGLQRHHLTYLNETCADQ